MAAQATTGSDTNTCSGLGNRIIRVNHAGEHGAINNHTGQIFMARWTAPILRGDLIRFRQHEHAHRALFEAELKRRGQRRCRSYALCGLGGRVLGWVTGLLGAGAIAATTVAVESVVLRHLHQQMDALRDIDPLGAAAVAAILDDERKHHDESVAQQKSAAVWNIVLKPIVSASTETVIWLGMRL